MSWRWIDIIVLFVTGDDGGFFGGDDVIESFYFDVRLVYYLMMKRMELRVNYLCGAVDCEGIRWLCGG